MNNNKIILTVGKSATGKTTIIDKICEKDNYKSIQSYTTRPKRYKGETGHIFVNKENYVFMDNAIIDKKNNTKIDLVAYTYFNENHYWADMNQVLNNHYYIIDKKGVDYFKEKVGDKIGYKVIYITVPLFTRIKRILKRDGFKKGISRLINDFKMFRGVKYDYKIVNKDLNKSVDEVYQISKQFLEE